MQVRQQATLIEHHLSTTDVDEQTDIQRDVS